METIVTEDEDKDAKVKDLVENSYQIILINDEVNSFEHVIDCLIKYCKHTGEQAEQCAIIVHHNGSCSVKQGSYNKLEPICTALLDHGLKAEIS